MHEQKSLKTLWNCWLMNFSVYFLTLSDTLEMLFPQTSLHERQIFLAAFFRFLLQVVGKFFGLWIQNKKWQKFSPGSFSSSTFIVSSTNIESHVALKKKSKNLLKLFLLPSSNIFITDVFYRTLSDSERLMKELLSCRCFCRFLLQVFTKLFRLFCRNKKWFFFCLLVFLSLNIRAYKAEKTFSSSSGYCKTFWTFKKE